MWILCAGSAHNPRGMALLCSARSPLLAGHVGTTRFRSKQVTVGGMTRVSLPRETRILPPCQLGRSTLSPRAVPHTLVHTRKFGNVFACRSASGDIVRHPPTDPPSLPPLRCFLGACLSEIHHRHPGDPSGHTGQGLCTPRLVSGRAALPGQDAQGGVCERGDCLPLGARRHVWHLCLPRRVARDQAPSMRR